jgi:hypothetical protein
MTGATSRSGDACVLAYTTRNDEHAPVRLAAIDHGRHHGCTVILYAADAASTLAEPMPNEWGSEGEGRDLGDRLTPGDLEFLGQAEIAGQVRAAMAAGLSAFGWLPKDHGPDALIEYAVDQGAHRIFVPAELEGMDEASAKFDGDATAAEALARHGLEVERVTTKAA